VEKSGAVDGTGKAIANQSISYNNTKPSYLTVHIIDATAGAQVISYYRHLLIYPLVTATS